MNAIAPVARTRMTLATPGGEGMKATENGEQFDFFAPGNVSPLIAYLAGDACPVTGTVFHVGGNQIGVFRGWHLDRTLETDGRWDVRDLEHAVPELLEAETSMASSMTDMASFNETFGSALRRALTPS